MAKTTTDIMMRINEQYPRMSKSHKTIAAYIVDHYDEAVFLTAAKLGERVGVSESTVVRFAIGLGYGGYPVFSHVLAEWVRGKLNKVETVSIKYGQSTHAEMITAVMESDVEKIRSTITALDPVSFEMAVESLLAAQTVYLIGLRSCEPLAEFLGFYLNMILKRIVLLKTTSVTELFEQMLHISDKDCIIGISFPRYSMRTLKAMEFARDRNAKVITITDSIHSPMNLYSSCNLLARSDSVSIVDSLVAPLSLINTLVVALCLKRPAKVKANLAALDAAWNNYQVYLNDEIDFIGAEPVLHYPLIQGKGENGIPNSD